VIVGSHEVQRQIMKNVGHDEWVSYLQRQCIELAENFSSDINRLCCFRKSLRQETESTIVNAAQFPHELEQTYRTMWQRWCGKTGFENGASS